MPWVIKSSLFFLFGVFFFQSSSWNMIHHLFVVLITLNWWLEWNVLLECCLVQPEFSLPLLLKKKNYCMFTKAFKFVCWVECLNSMAMQLIIPPPPQKRKIPPKSFSLSLKSAFSKIFKEGVFSLVVLYWLVEQSV